MSDISLQVSTGQTTVTRSEHEGETRTREHENVSTSENAGAATKPERLVKEMIERVEVAASGDGR
jgi:hypothetical protein